MSTTAVGSHDLLRGTDDQIPQMVDHHHEPLGETESRASVKGSEAEVFLKQALESAEHL